MRSSFQMTCAQYEGRKIKFKSICVITQQTCFEVKPLIRRKPNTVKTYNH